MRRQGADENNLSMDDVLCDFCRRAWTHDLPMVEGHRGSCICGRCLTVAYTALVLGASEDGGGRACTLCLQTRDEPTWESPAWPDAVVCRRCVKQAAGVLHKDKESGWSRPA